MSKGTRKLRCNAWTALIGAALAVTGPAATAEQPTDARKPAKKLTPAQVVESLGPGPLPWWAPAHRGPHDRPKAEGIRRRIDACVEADMTALDAPGAAVAVLLDGEMLYESGYGVKLRGGSDAVDPETIFRIGSVTKQMTAAAVMQQVELGRVDLEAPVTDYIPELVVDGRWPADRIAVWHALTHTTGFPDIINDHTSVGNGALSHWATLQGGIELHAPPGSFWNYSNPNFMIAGLVAERASGTPYRDLIEESVWQPAEMLSTTFDPERVIATGNYSFGHYFDASGRSVIVGPDDNDLWAAGPAGFAFSTVGDLVHWALLLMDGGGAVLSPRSAAAMQAPQQWQHYTPDLYYGYGIMVDRYQGLDIRQHGGNVAGYGTYLLWVPERRFAVALLTNVTSSLTAAAYCIVDEVLEPEPQEPQDLRTDPSTWDRYQGDYVMTETDGTQWSASVYRQGDRLLGATDDPDHPGETITLELYQAFLDTFVFDGDLDGTPETDITFCSTGGDPGIVMWLRNRSAVGVRQLVPRAGAHRAGP